MQVAAETDGDGDVGRGGDAGFLFGTFSIADAMVCYRVPDCWHLLRDIAVRTMVLTLMY